MTAPPSCSKFILNISLLLRGICTYYLHNIILVGIAICIGVAVGTIDWVFFYVLSRVTSTEAQHYKILVPFMIPFALLTVLVYDFFGHNATAGLGILFARVDYIEQRLPELAKPSPQSESPQLELQQQQPSDPTTSTNNSIELVAPTTTIVGEDTEESAQTEHPDVENAIHNDNDSNNANGEDRGDGGDSFPCWNNSISCCGMPPDDSIPPLPCCPFIRAKVRPITSLSPLSSFPIIPENPSLQVPHRGIPLILGFTWASHLFGASVGREGVAVQIGGFVSTIFYRWIVQFIGYISPLHTAYRMAEYEIVMILTGCAAGFSGLYHSPLASAFFVMELSNVGQMKYRALMPAIIGSYTAHYISHRIGAGSFFVNVPVPDELQTRPELVLLLKLLCFGVFMALCSSLFTYSNFLLSYLAKKYKINPYFKALVLSIIVMFIVLFAHHNRYASLGTNLIDDATAVDQTKRIFYYDWFIKIIVTVLSLNAGFKGGEITPIFSIGSSFGWVIADVLKLNKSFGAALGYIGLFAGTTQTLLGPIIMGVEQFGPGIIIPAIIVCSTSFLCSGQRSIYGNQSRSFIKWSPQIL